MESENTVGERVTLSLDLDRPTDKDDDIWYILFGDADWGTILVSAIYIVAFGGLLAIGIFSYNIFSGGMRWLIALFLTSCLAVVSVLMMKRGVQRQKEDHVDKAPKTSFPGQLSDLTNIVERASSGFAYSQQLIRERAAEVLTDKARISKGMDDEDVARSLEQGDASFIKDEHLAKFLLENKRGADGWDEKVKREGRSKESGRRFMVEINEILDRMEAMT